MQKPKSLLETNKSNYTPATNEKHLVHYKAEKIKYDPTTGVRKSHPELLKTGVKLFAMIKREMENEGYAIEILYHPNGSYNTPVNVPEAVHSNDEVEALKAQIAEKEAKIQTLEDKLDAILAKLGAGEEKAPEAEKTPLEKAREAKAAKDAAKKENK